MQILISPAKTLDFETPTQCDRASQPIFLNETEILVRELQTLSAQEISSLMQISDALGELNATRYQAWQFDCDSPVYTKQALLAFRGDVYQGLNADSFTPVNWDFAQEHLSILSGLYGVLRPLDLIQPYRLEMGTKLTRAKFPNLTAKSLYDFWQDKITYALATQLEKLNSKTIVNLASKEYFKVVKPRLLSADIVTPIFKDWKNNQYKVVSFYAKKARGMMAAYIIENQLDKIEEIKEFEAGGYSFNDELSDSKNLVFTRKDSH